MRALFRWSIIPPGWSARCWRAEVRHAEEAPTGPRKARPDDRLRRRLEAWPQTRLGPPFETPPAAAPQGEGLSELDFCAFSPDIRGEFAAFEYGLNDEGHERERD